MKIVFHILRSENGVVMFCRDDNRIKEGLVCLA